MVEWHHQSMDMSLSRFREMVKNREAWHAVVQGFKELGMTEQRYLKMPDSQF